MMERGLSFLSSVVPKDIFTPEDLNEEQKMLRDTVEKFMKEEVLKREKEIESGKIEVVRDLLKRAGELGIIAIEYPKEYGGLELDKVTALCVNEVMMYNTSFAVSAEAHVTIGSHPIIFFGTEEQKRKYLPDLASAKKIAAYALTEPSAGSDALSAKTTATPIENGKYFILNGTKQFITNAGFADIFIVFAKVNGKDFTAFIVEREFGVKTGKEEEKMGQKGSSTRQVILEDVKVPAENVLGEIGKGHKVALNTLNLGRMRLGGVSGGAGFLALKKSIEYAKQRKQFGRAIIEFPLIKWKISHMASKSFAAQSAAYRIANAIDKLWIQEGLPQWQAFEEFAVEATILKVGGTEMLWYVVDEAVQIHGGYGYIKEYEVERYYRDERVNRIYEGTNEINRLNIPEMIIRRAMKGRFDFFGLIEKSKKDIEDMQKIKSHISDFTAKEELFALEVAKRLLVIKAGEAFTKFKEEIQNEQEILSAFSDIAIIIFLGESAIARATKHKNTQYGKLYENMAKLFVHSHWLKLVQSFELMSHRIDGDTKIGEKLFNILQKSDVVSLSRQIADEIKEKI